MVVAADHAQCRCAPHGGRGAGARLASGPDRECQSGGERRGQGAVAEVGDEEGRGVGADERSDGSDTDVRGQGTDHRGPGCDGAGGLTESGEGDGRRGAGRQSRGDPGQGPSGEQQREGGGAGEHHQVGEHADGQGDEKGAHVVGGGPVPAVRVEDRGEQGEDECGEVDAEQGGLQQRGESEAVGVVRDERIRQVDPGYGEAERQGGEGTGDPGDAVLVGHAVNSSSGPHTRQPTGL